MALRFDIGTNPAIIARAHAIRHAVFVVEQKIDPEIEWDALDESASHFIAVDEEMGGDIGTGRALLTGDLVTLQRIAVLKERRGLNAGYALVASMLEWAKKQPKIRRAELGAQCYAIAFYEKLGFKAYGDIYHDADIAHRHMRRAI